MRDILYIRIKVEPRTSPLNESLRAIFCSLNGGKMKVTLKDGSAKEYDSKKSIIDIAKDISEGLARSVVAGEVNGVCMTCEMR